MLTNQKRLPSGSDAMDHTAIDCDEASKALASSFDTARAIGMAIDPRTLRVYKQKVRKFDAWCAARQRPACPTSDETLAVYISELADSYHFNTLRGIVSAVSFANRVTGLAFTPTLTLEVLSGIARVHGVASQTRAPIEGGDLVRLVASCPDSPRGRRDRALLLLGFCAGLGSDEIVGIDYAARGPDACGHARISPHGMHIEILRAATMRTDARAVVKFLPRRAQLCPVAALEQWVDEARITCGPLFRRIDQWGHIGNARLLAKTAPTIVRKIVARAELAAGASQAAADRIASRYAMKSLRSGFIKSAFAAGASEERVASHLGYTSAQVLRDYRRRHVALRDHPTRAVLLKERATETR